ncbi:hypothetical protein K474DRAFT_1672034 [Panus rudis PR-1116 ss-1]|nr:hypothetical protein K474DRAFT_1672034 [Panus rudis PR-1116 ss-1]
MSSSMNSVPPSPRGARPQSAGFDSGGGQPGPQQGYFDQHPSQAPILRQPVGFSHTAPSAGVPATYPAAIQPPPRPQYLPGQGMAVDEGGKEHRKKKKHRDKEKSKSKSSRGVDPGAYGAAPSYHSAGPSAIPSVQNPSLHVNSYASNPSSPTMPYSMPGPSYYSDRDHPMDGSGVSRRPSSSKSRSHRSEGRAQGMEYAQQPDPRRNEYDERRAYASPIDQYPMAPPPQGGYAVPTVPSGQAPPSDVHRSRSHRSREHRSHSIISNPPANLPTATQQSPAPMQPGPSSTIPEVPTRPPPVLRILTVLIEDKRHPDAESQLAEVRVPLRQADDPEDGYWADAKDVCEELQATPSRIDGPAKVYTMRGKYRQIFLRVTSDGAMDCTSANLKVNKDRTLEVFVEYNSAALPTVRRTVYDQPLVSPTVEGIPPSSADSVATPPPTGPVSPEGQSPSRFEFENLEDSSTSRKRRHSVQASPEAHPSRRPSPFTNRAPSMNPQGPSTSPVASRNSPGSHGPESSSTLQAGAGQPQPQQTSVFSANDRSASRASSGSHRASPGTQATSPTLTSTSPSLPAPPSQTRSSHPSQSPFGSYQVAHPSRDTAATSPPSAPPLPGPSSPKKARGHGLDANRVDNGANNHWGPRGSSTSPSTTTPGNPPSLSGFAAYNQSATFGAASFKSASQAALANYASSPLPTASAPSDPIEAKVIAWLKDIFTKEAGFNDFVASRNALVPVSEVVKVQYAYIQSKVDVFGSKLTPPDLPGAGGIPITKLRATQQAHVLKAFNLPQAWGEEMDEITRLNKLYGPGTKYEDPEVKQLYVEKPTITTSMNVRKYIDLLRGIEKRNSQNTRPS